VATRIRLCGRFEIELAGVRVEKRLPGRQAPLVVAFLVLNRARPVTRDELIAALWTQAPPADPDAVLRPLLSRVRQALGADVLTGRGELALALPDDVEIDVEQAHAAADRASAAVAGEQWHVAREAAAEAVPFLKRLAR
jgi:DNA-binding SARP family transcriptional activator